MYILYIDDFLFLSMQYFLKIDLYVMTSVISEKGSDVIYVRQEPAISKVYR